MSKEALHNSFELANSNVPLPPFPILSPSLNPLPSSMFFLTRASGLGGYFLASAPGNLPPQEFKKIAERNIKINNT